MMKKLAPMIVLVAMAGCNAQQYTQAGYSEGVTVSYRWRHTAGGPSELLLKLVNASDSARAVHVGLDLYFQGLTVERFSADTCITAKRTMNGKINGFYFVPQTLTPEQAASPETRVDLTGFTVEREAACH